MQWTGTLLRDVAHFRLRSGLAMWMVHQTLPLSLNYGGLICFLALLSPSFVMVRCLRETNVAIFCGRFSWSRKTSLSKGFSYYFHDSTTFVLNYIFVLLLANVDVIPNQKRSVHTSANLIFYFSNKNGKRKYYLSLPYLHI